MESKKKMMNSERTKPEQSSHDSSVWCDGCWWGASASTSYSGNTVEEVWGMERRSEKEKVVDKGLKGQNTASSSTTGEGWESVWGRKSFDS